MFKLLAIIFVLIIKFYLVFFILFKLYARNNILNLVNMLIIDSKKGNEKMQKHEPIKIYLSRVTSVVPRVFCA